MMIRIRKFALILLLCLITVLIVGCGANEKEKKAMFQSLIKENLIAVGESDFDDFVDVKTVSNAPVPAVQNTIFMSMRIPCTAFALKAIWKMTKRYSGQQ